MKMVKYSPKLRWFQEYAISSNSFLTPLRSGLIIHGSDMQTVEATTVSNVRIVTIGLYGFDEDDFFDSLVAARVNVFCDLRQRRGVRGKLYRYANSSRLQQRLHALGIAYYHCKQLA